MEIDEYDSNAFEEIYVVEFAMDRSPEVELVIMGEYFAPPDDGEELVVEEEESDEEEYLEFLDDDELDMWVLSQGG